MKRIIDLYRTQCPSLFNTGMEGDLAFLTVLGVGGDYLQHLVGDYLRCRTDRFLNPIFVASENELAKRVSTLSVEEWAQDSPHFKILKKIWIENEKSPTDNMPQVSYSTYSSAGAIPDL